MDNQKLIQECGFNSFEEVVKRVNELVDVMRVGRARAEKYLDRFNNEAKQFLKDGQKDKAKRVLTKKKKHAERVKTIDSQLDIILGKLREVKNSTQMLQVMKAIKYCNNLLLSELDEKDFKENNTENNENQDLIDNDKEICKYLDILAKNTAKKAKPKPAPSTVPMPVPAPSPVSESTHVDKVEDKNQFPQPEDNENTFPMDNNDMMGNNNYSNQNKIEQTQNQAQNPYVNKNVNNNNIFNNNSNTKKNYDYNDYKNNNYNNNINNNFNNNNNYNNNNNNLNNIINNNNYNNNNYNNNFNNNNFNNNNFNNYNNNNFNNNNYQKKVSNPYDKIF